MKKFYVYENIVAESYENLLKALCENTDFKKIFLDFVIDKVYTTYDIPKNEKLSLINEIHEKTKHLWEKLNNKDLTDVEDIMINAEIFGIIEDITNTSQNTIDFFKYYFEDDIQEYNYYD